MKTIIRRVANFKRPIAERKELTYNGQVIEQVLHGTEYVKCAACNDEHDLIGTNTTAYFDPYVIFGENKGAYVHSKCLSERRLKEIKDSTSKSK